MRGLCSSRIFMCCLLGDGRSMSIYRAVLYCTREDIAFVGRMGSVRVASCLYRLMGDRRWVLSYTVDSSMSMACCGMGGRVLLCVLAWVWGMSRSTFALRDYMLAVSWPPIFMLRRTLSSVWGRY